MGKVLALALTGISLLAACGDGGSRSLPSTMSSGIRNADREAVAYGWTRPVSTKAFPEGKRRFGNAESPICGNSLRGIVTDDAVRVRSDDKACSSCHAWASKASRGDFCDRVPAFLEQPTSKGDGHDDIAAKPLVLKDLLDRWYEAGCPE